MVMSNGEKREFVSTEEREYGERGDTQSNDEEDSDKEDGSGDSGSEDEYTTQDDKPRKKLKYNYTVFGGQLDADIPEDPDVCLQW